MARIRIDDLPLGENLTPEEEALILGAGRRPSFRPMLESLENREMYAANVTAAVTAGVLHVGAQHVEGTPQDDHVAIRRVENQIQVLSGPKNEMVGNFDAAQVKSIDVLMAGGHNMGLDLTGLGALGSGAHFNTKGDDGGTAHVRYLNQTGHQVREFEAGGRHNKETTMANGDKVLEQSWQAGSQTFHFMTVTDAQGRRLVTGEDNGNGFVVTKTNPGVGQTKFKFDRYGGEWDGKNWVPEQGQKLVERDGQAVNGEWKMVDNKLRWEMTTGTRETNQRIGVYEKYGNNGDGEGIVSLQEYSNGKLTLKETHTADGKVVKEHYTNEQLTRKETKLANGDSVAENYTNGQLTRKETTSKGVSVVEDYKNGAVIRRETKGGEFQSQIETFNDAGKLQTRETRYGDGRTVHGEWKAGKWVETTTGSKEFKERTEVYDSEARTTLLERSTTLNGGWNSDTSHVVETLQADGSWKVTSFGRTSLSAGEKVRQFKTQTEVFDKMGGKLLSHEKIYTDGQSIRKEWIAGKWVETTREANGSYVRNVWTKSDHGSEGSGDHISKSVLDKERGVFQVFNYHVRADIWWGGLPYSYSDATEVRQYSLNKDGTPNLNDLTQYNVHYVKPGYRTEPSIKFPKGQWIEPVTYSNSWYKAGTPGKNTYSNGWMEWRYGGAPALDNPTQYLA
jgi:hypothetical protein